MIAPAGVGIDLFPQCGSLHARVDSLPQDVYDFPCPVVILQNNTPNNTSVSRHDSRHGVMLLVDRASGTDGNARRK